MIHVTWIFLSNYALFQCQVTLVLNLFMRLVLGRVESASISLPVGSSEKI